MLLFEFSRATALRFKVINFNQSNSLKKNVKKINLTNYHKIITEITNKYHQYTYLSTYFFL